MADASNPQVDEQIFTVYETLNDLKVGDKPVITVFNKQDKLEGSQIIRDFRADYTVKISAKTGEGIPELTETIEAVLREQKIAVEGLYDYKETAKIQLIRKYGELTEEEYREDGIFVRGYVPSDIWDRVSLGDSEKRRR